MSGRKANKDMPTEQRSYMFYSRDVQTALNNDWQPKHVFRMGIKALQNNPEILQRVNSSETDIIRLKEKIALFSKMLHVQFRRNEKLREILEELTGAKIEYADPDGSGKK